MFDADCVLFYCETPAYVVSDGRYLTLQELRDEADALQRSAIAAKLAGEHATAVQCYRELLPLVRQLDALEELPVFGVYPQLVQRAIELEEENCPVYPSPEA